MNNNYIAILGLLYLIFGGYLLYPVLGWRGLIGLWLIGSSIVLDIEIRRNK